MPTGRLINLAGLLWVVAFISQVDAQQRLDSSNIVRVFAGNNGGSGVYLGGKIVLTAAHVFDGANSRAIVVFPDGSRFGGILRASDTTWDQAAIELSGTPTVAGAPLATSNPKIGETVYAAGYPNAGDRVDWITGRVQNYASASRGVGPTDWFIFDGRAARAGSSGGPVFNTNGEVIGNLWGSRTTEMTTTATMCGRTRLFLNPFKRRFGQEQSGQQSGGRGRQVFISPREIPGDCQDGCEMPGSRDVHIVPRDPGGQAPIIDGSPINGQPINGQPPIVVQPPQIDYSAIAEIIWQKIQENPEQFRGPPGPAGQDAQLTPDKINEIVNGLKNDQGFLEKTIGPPGPIGPIGPPGELTANHMAAMVSAILQNLKQDPVFISELQGSPGPAGLDGQDGQDGLDGQDAEVTADQLATMTAAILRNLKTDPEFVDKAKGPQGPEGPPGVCDLTDLENRIAVLEGNVVNIPESEWSHLVLVADSSADYWRRLSGEFERTRGHWGQMRHVESPNDRYIGPLPVLVAYQAGKAIRTWSGVRDVSQALSNITRGNYDEFIFASK